jgi:hypothetical protein
MGRQLVIVAVLAACGGATGPAGKAPVVNTTEPPTMQPRDQVVTDAINALAAGSIDRLMALADPKGLLDRGIACKADDYESRDMRQLEDKLRRDFTEAAGKAKGSTIEIVSIKNEIRGLTGRSRYGGGARNANFVAKGGSVSKGCTAKTDLVFHEVEVKLRVKQGAQAAEHRVTLDLVSVGGRWHVVKVPRDISTGALDTIATMEKFQKAMCDCKDKACADKVNEDMTKWGTEMARTADYDARPDPDMAKRSADIMTKYVDCMTKLMMADANQQGTP